MPAHFRCIEQASPAGLVFEMLRQARAAGRLSAAECALVHALVWHPDFPDVLGHSKSLDRLPLLRALGVAHDGLED